MFNVGEIIRLVQPLETYLYYIYFEDDEVPVPAWSWVKPVLKKRTKNEKVIYETSYKQGRSKAILSTRLPVIGREKKAISSLPNWAVYHYSVHFAKDSYVFLRGERGELRLPKSYNEEILSLIFKKPCIITTNAEWFYE